MEATETVEFWQRRKNQELKWEPWKYNIPRKFYDCSFDSYQGTGRLVDDLKAYRSGGLVLRGICGCGKTHLAVSILKHLVERESQARCDHNIDQIEAGRPENIDYSKFSRKWFVTVPDFLLEIRESFRDNSTMTERDIIKEFATVPFLILDDLGSEKASEYAITSLYILIDHRDRELRDTIITTNLTQAQIEDRLNARIASRLAGWKNVVINMKDYRKGK